VILPDDCRRYEALLDRRVVGQTLPPQDDAFLDRHAAGCPECAYSGALLDELARAGEQEEPDAGDAAAELEARRIVAAHELRRRKRRRQWIRGGIAAAAAAAVVTLALVLPQWQGETPAPAPVVEEGTPPAEEVAPIPAIPSLPPATLVRVDGRAWIDGHPATQGDRMQLRQELAVDRGAVLLLLADGSTLDAGAGVRLRVDRASEEAVALTLARGDLALDVPGEDGEERLALSTAEGTAFASRARFSVGLEDELLVVDVETGRVRLELTGGEVREVQAGERVEVSSSEASVDPPPAVPPAPAPPPAAVEATAEGSPGETELPSDAVALAEPAPPAAAALPEPTADDLLHLARQARLAGDWPAAAEAYRYLVERFPDDPLAVTCLVSLGQVQLEHLDQPEAALTSFTAYLAADTAGPLAEEAAWGIARAHLHLGDHDAAREALTRYLDEYPRSLHAGDARGWLEELRELGELEEP